MKGFLAIALLIAVCPVGAQNLYRCVDYQGAVSIQDAPCPPASRETRRVAVDAYEETATSRAARAAAVHRAQAAREIGSFRPASHAVRRTPTRPLPWEPDSQGDHACASAKRYRDSVLNAAGLNRTFELLRSLDDAVYRACRR